LEFELLTSAGIVFALVVVGAIFLFIARRILRLALRLAFVMAIIFMLIAGAGVGWWRGWFGTETKSRTPAGATNKRHVGANGSSR
jgi:hypothetical protein